MILSGCRQNAPISLSNPHFSQADRQYADQVSFLKESQPTNSYFIIDQKTSIPSEVLMSLQLNVMLESQAGLEMLKELR